MRAIMCLAAVLFVAGCDTSSQQLATTQATLAQATKERDDLKAKVVSLQKEVDNTKTQLAQAKSVPTAANGAVAAKTSDTKAASTSQGTTPAKAKHGHKS